MISIKKAPILFIFITVFIDITGFGLIFPVLPKLIEELTHGDISTAASYGGWLSFSYALMQFIFAPVLGNLSDAIGRRPVLLASLFGFGIDCLFLAFAPSMLWLFVGRTIAGMTGASYSVATAYIADISSPEERAKNFGLVNSAFGAGFIAGPVIGGLLGGLGTHAPFIAAASLSLLNVLFGYFVIPESLTQENRRVFEWKRSNPVGALKYLNKFSGISVFIAAIVCTTMANHSMESVWSYYTIQKFHWNEQWIGYSLGLVGVLSIVVQAWFVGFITTKIGELKTVFTGLVLTLIGFLLFAFTNNEWIFIAAIIPYVAGSIEGTALQSILSNAVPDNEQGELQGSLGGLMGLTTIVSPPVMTMSFAYFSKEDTSYYFPGMPFMIAAVLILISLWLILKGIKKVNVKKI